MICWTFSNPRLLSAELDSQRAQLPSALFDELGEAVREMHLPSDASPRVLPAQIDYVELATLHRGGKNRRRVGQRFR